MRDISMTYWYGNPSNILSRINYLKLSGFKSISLHWVDEYTSSNGFKEDIMQLCEQNGLEVKVFHLPFESADDLWKNTLDGDNLFEIYYKAILDASRYQVKYVVMHLTEKLTKINDPSLGKKRLEKLLQVALKHNVMIAFENLQHYDALEHILKMFNYDNAVLCFDIGHYNINPNNIIDKYKEKIKVCHLHSNNGKDDTHDLITDGNCDLKLFEEVLRENSKIEIVLEIKNNKSINEKEFLTIAKMEAEKILRQMEEKQNEEN